MKLEIKVNGEARKIDVDRDTPLLWVLRDELRLTGTKYSCGVAQCGACTVHLAGRPVRSCGVPISAVKNREVVTIEGVRGPEAAAVKEAWSSLQVPQCGFCQSGQMMTAIRLLEKIPRPTDDDIDGAMTGNVCRCATYGRVRQAIHDASRAMGGR